MKQSKIAPALAVLLGITLLPSCKLGKFLEKKKDSETERTEQPAVNPLLGDYTTGCRSEEATSSEVLSLRFTADQVMLVNEEFSGRECGTKVSTTHIYSTYKLGATRGASVSNIDYRELQIDKTPENETVTADWSRVHHCGISDWKLSWPRTIDKHSGCVGDTQNGRPTFSVIRLEGNTLRLGMQDDRNQDGLLPETRYTGVSDITFEKTSFAQPPRPDPAENCPFLPGNYVCLPGGDVFFAEKNVAVSMNSLRGHAVHMKLSRSGYLPVVQDYLPEGGMRGVQNGGFTIQTRDFCEPGVLKSFVVSSRTGDFRNRSTTTRSFKLDEQGNLLIDSYFLDFVDDRQDGEQRLTTSCTRII